MNCDLLVPNLYWPAAAAAEPYRGLAAPALETLLARGQRTRTAGASLERWLAAAYGLPAGLPLAPYALRGDGVDPGGDNWVHADPVHLKVHRDHLILADAARIHVSPDEAREFAALLGAHLAAENIAIIAPHPQRWYLRIAHEPRLGTVPTSEVAGRSIEPFLPAGEDGARWRRVINEAQMLLHDHPTNQKRETRNELPVNSIWLWGAGRARPLTPTYDAVWSDHPAVIGLAAAGGVAVRRLPASGEQLRKELGAGSNLVALASLPATAYGDVAAWRTAVTLLERDWFAPLLAALADGGLDTITLHGLGSDFGMTTEYRRNDRFRFWRRRQALNEYVS